MIARDDQRPTRHFVSIRGWLLVLYLLTCAGCDAVDAPRESVGQSSAAISFGPCRDCLFVDAIDGGLPMAVEGAWSTARAVEHALGADDDPIAVASGGPVGAGHCHDCDDDTDDDRPGGLHPNGGYEIEISDLVRIPPVDIRFGCLGCDRVPEVEWHGQGPAGMGPCADCLIVSVKRDDLALADGETVHRVDAAHLELTDGARVPAAEAVPWGRGVADDGQPEVWVGIPLAALKVDGFWAIAAVHLTLSLKNGDAQREVEAPPRSTRVEAGAAFMPDP